MKIEVGQQYLLNGSSLRYEVYAIHGASTAIPNLERTIYLELSSRPPLFTSPQRFISVPDSHFKRIFRERGIAE